MRSRQAAIGHRQSAAIVVLLLTALACSRGHRSSVVGHPIAMQEQTSGTTALLQAVSVVNGNVAWVSGHRATWARTTDGGATWSSGSMTGADTVLQFRDVHAVNADIAYLLAAGPGQLSRIYKTTNGGRTWDRLFLNTDTSAFYDCFDFWDASNGVVVSDAVGGQMPVRVTVDGSTWFPPRMRSLTPFPPALPGEGAFAASGTCLVARPGGRAWIGTGAETGARVYRTRDFGGSWSVVTTPVASGAATGIASLAFRDDRNGIALGGRIAQADSFSDNVAVTRDGGETWTLAARTPFSGAVYGSAFVPGRRLLVAVSPRGMAYTTDDAGTWTQLSSESWWAVGFGPGGIGYAVGPRGRITRLDYGNR